MSRSEESEFTTWSENAKQTELNVDSQTGIPEIAKAAIKGTWQVKKGITGAVLLMNKPRMKRITSDVLKNSRKSSSFNPCASLPKPSIALPSSCTFQIQVGVLLETHTLIYENAVKVSP